MNILYVINSYADGGAEHGLATLVENGFFDGHDLRVVALCKGNGWAYERLSRTLGDDRVDYLFEETGAVANALMLRSLAGLVRTLRERRTDLLFLSLPQANLVGRVVALAFPGVRVVTFEHSVTFRRKAAAMLMRLTAGRVDAVLYDAPQTWTAMRRTYGRNWLGRALYVPLTVLTCREDEPRPPSRPPPRTLRLLTTGRLIPQKNHAALIKAVRILLDQGHSVTLEIAGDGPERAALQRLIDRWGLDGSVTLHGFVRDCAPLRRACDVYVQPSLYEGLCIAVLEAMAEGMLVVATDVGGIRDYGIDGRNIIKTSGFAPEALTDALLRAREELDRNGSIRQEALNTVRSHFSKPATEAIWSNARAALGMQRS